MPDDFDLALNLYDPDRLGEIFNCQITFHLLMDLTHTWKKQHLMT